MSETLRFGFESRKGFRLVVGGPKAIMDEAFDSEAQQRARAKINNHSTLTSRIAGRRTIVNFNARAIGRLTDERKSDALAYANGFISELVELTKKGRVEPDPRLSFSAYTPTWDGYEFLFEANVARPTETQGVADRIGAFTMRMAYQLRAYPHATRIEDYERYVTGDIDLERSGVAVRIRPHSSLHTNGADWDPAAERFELRSNNVLNGEQPLIFLATAVALAHADELG